MKNSVNTLNAIAATLLVVADPEFEISLRAETEKLGTRWKKVVELCRRHKDKLTQSLEKTTEAVDEIRAMDEWIAQSTKEHLRREYAVHSLQELDAFSESFKVKFKQLVYCKV